MGKVLEFKKTPLRVELSKPTLSPEEEQACTIAASLRTTFTDKQVEQIKKELENEVP